MWAIQGIADEWPTDAPDPMGLKRIKVFKRMLLGPLDRIDWRTSDDFDYAVIEAVYDDSYDGPQSLAGYSGGGLWQLIIKHVEGVPTVTDRLLMGVDFYQTDKTVHGGKPSREIICHGRESIYRTLIDQVYENLAG